jgi:hypothetical protein
MTSAFRNAMRRVLNIREYVGANCTAIFRFDNIGEGKFGSLSRDLAVGCESQMTPQRSGMLSNMERSRG